MPIPAGKPDGVISAGFCRQRYSAETIGRCAFAIASVSKSQDKARTSFLHAHVSGMTPYPTRPVLPTGKTLCTCSLRLCIEVKAPIGAFDFKSFMSVAILIAS